MKTEEKGAIIPQKCLDKAWRPLSLGFGVFAIGQDFTNARHEKSRRWRYGVALQARIEIAAPRTAGCETHYAVQVKLD
jgi:hypothetical protein